MPRIPHPIQRRLASTLAPNATTTSNNPLAPRRAAGLNLLPPIPLYRRLLRAHRKHLPAEMRVLGDEYVRHEFRAHRGVENPVHLVCFCSLFLFFFCCLLGMGMGMGWGRVGGWDKGKGLGSGVGEGGWADSVQVGFLTEWQLYAQKIEGEAWKGEKLDEGKVAKMSGMFSFPFLLPYGMYVGC